MPKYISGRTKLRDSGKLTADRYRYLGLDQAEPNLGDPPDGTPPTGAIPSGDRYQIVSVDGHPGERYWIPVEGGIIPGTFTIYDEGTLVGGINSTSQLNFVGAAISASSINTFKETTLTLRDSLTFSFTVGLGVTQKNSDAFGYVKESTTNSGIVTITNVTGSFTTNAADELFEDSVGIARTPVSKSAVINASVASSITVSPEFFSTNEQVIFNDNGEFNGAGGLVYRKNGAGDDTNVGLASVGIGTTNPYRTLHVNGDIKLTGSIEDYNSSRGNLGDLLVKNNFGGIEWTDQRSVTVGAAGTFYEVQFHGATGYLNGADKLVYRSDLNGGQIGIGSTIPTKLLDVLGDSIFTGDVTFDGATAGYDALWDRSANAFIVKDNAKFAAGTDSDLQIYHNNTHAYIENNKGDLFIRNNVDDLDGGDIYIQALSGENSIVINPNQGVYLYYNGGLPKAYTDSSGFYVKGRLYVESGTSQFHGDVRFDGQTAGRDIYFDESENSLYAYDNAQFRVGNGGDVRIYHDGSNTYIEPKTDGVGDLIVGSATTDIAKFVYNGGVSLYYQDVLKFETIGVGVSVYDTAYIPNLITVGIATIDNIQIGHSNDNTINTKSGNLILDSADGTVEVEDVLYVDNTTASTNATTGALRVDGGAGIAGDLNVGGGVTTGGRLKVNTHVDINSGFGTFDASVGVATAIDEFNVITSEFKTAEYTLHFEQTDSRIHSQKVLVMIGGTTTAHSQEFAIMYHPDRMVSFDSTVSAGICTLFATPLDSMTGLTTFRFSRSSLL